MSKAISQGNNPTHRWRQYCARLGWASVLFFTVKGLAWLILPAVLLWFSEGDHVRDHGQLFELAALASAALLSVGGVALIVLGLPQRWVRRQPLRRGRILGAMLMVASWFIWRDIYGPLSGLAIVCALILSCVASLAWFSLRQSRA